MKASAKGLIRVLVLVLASSVAAHADPITYTMSGQISYLGGVREDFVGSFELSDPTIDRFDLSDSRGVQRDWYTVQSFTLTSSSYSLTGMGVFVAWWGRFADFNAIDSILSIATSGGLLETPVFDCCTWTGALGTQPTHIFSDTLGSFGEPYRLHNFTAAPSIGVPEPSTLLLYGLGVVGLAAFRRRARATRGAGGQTGIQVT
jgi:hypothetical protein